jgi:hypothetical protein
LWFHSKQSWGILVLEDMWGTCLLIFLALFPQRSRDLHLRLPLLFNSLTFLTLVQTFPILLIPYGLLWNSRHISLELYPDSQMVRVPGKGQSIRPWGSSWTFHHTYVLGCFSNQRGLTHLGNLFDKGNISDPILLHYSNGQQGCSELISGSANW